MATGKVYLKTDEEIECIRKSCQIACLAIAEVVKEIKPGYTGLMADKLAESFIRDSGATPSFLGYGKPAFPASLCISVNQAVVHGIPIDKPFKSGDIVSLDCGAYLNGFHGDVAYTVIIGEVDEKVAELCAHTKKSLYLAIDEALHGKRLGDLGEAIQNYMERKHKYGVVREMVGHGIGKDLHEAPDVCHYGKRGHGILLQEGLVIAIEPMVNLGTRQIKTMSDYWTVVSKDGSPSAHYEHTVAVRREKADILTSHTEIEESIKNNKELREISPKI